MALSMFNVNTNESMNEWFQSQKAVMTVQTVALERKNKVNNTDSAETLLDDNSKDSDLEEDLLEEKAKKYINVSVDYNKNMDYDEDGEVSLDEKFKYYSIQVAERLDELKQASKKFEEEQIELIKENIEESEKVEDEDSVLYSQNTEAKEVGNLNTDNTVGKETAVTEEDTSTDESSDEKQPEKGAYNLNEPQFKKAKSAYFNDSLVNKSILALSA